MEKRFLEAGQIVSTHGVQGEVKILPWADGPEFLLDFDTLYLNGRPYDVLSSRVHKTCVLAKLRGVDTPEQATLLRGQTVSIDLSGVRLPEGTVFIADLIGCRVVTEEGEEIGRLSERDSTVYHEVVAGNPHNLYIKKIRMNDYNKPTVKILVIVRERRAAE